jgi:plastocyanin
MVISPPSARRAAALLSVVLFAGLAGCGGGGGASTSLESTATAPGGGSPAKPASGAQTVDIKDFAFTPAELTVASGTTIVFPNEDKTPHTATAKTGAFDSGPIEPGSSGKVTLEKTGTFTYYCQFHPFMTGTITVE